MTKKELTKGIEDNPYKGDVKITKLENGNRQIEISGALAKKLNVDAERLGISPSELFNRRIKEALAEGDKILGKDKPKEGGKE